VVFVEGSQKTDWEEFYSIVDLADPDLNEKLRQWQDYYNHERPHGSLNNRTHWEVWWELGAKTPLTEEVEAMCDPTKERFRARHYRADLEPQKLKGCRWPVRNGEQEFGPTKIERMLVVRTHKIVKRRWATSP
jgi:hypothetical protein